MAYSSDARTAVNGMGTVGQELATGIEPASCLLQVSCSIQRELRKHGVAGMTAGRTPISIPATYINEPLTLMRVALRSRT